MPRKPESNHPDIRIGPYLLSVRTTRPHAAKGDALHTPVTAVPAPSPTVLTAREDERAVLPRPLPVASGVWEILARVTLGGVREGELSVVGSREGKRTFPPGVCGLSRGAGCIANAAGRLTVGVTASRPRVLEKSPDPLGGGSGAGATRMLPMPPRPGVRSWRR